MLSFQYLSNREYNGLDTDAKLKLIFKIVKKNKIVLMQGRLKPQEEAQLIEQTMGQITKKFSGISFCTILPEQQNGKKNGKKGQTSGIFKNAVYNLFMKNRDTLTIIGPASLVKEIRKNPNRIDLMLE